MVQKMRKKAKERDLVSASQGLMFHIRLHDCYGRWIPCVLIMQKMKKANAKERDSVSASQGLIFSSMAAPGGGF